MKIIHLLLLMTTWAGAQVPGDCGQVVVGIAENWQSTHVTLTVYEKQGKVWNRIGKPWQGRLGGKGLAWGHGLHRQPVSAAPVKGEGDKRAPAGIFKIGGAYGYAAQIAKHPQLFYRHITPQDLWVEDRQSPLYNRHIILDHPPRTSWQQKAQMRQNDHAHSLKLYIAHNDAIMGGNPVPGLGSAIFFHIWRQQGKQATAGCTTMSEAMLTQLIARIDPHKNPVYVLLPEAEYQHLRKAWKLP